MNDLNSYALIVVMCFIALAVSCGFNAIHINDINAKLKSIEERTI